MTKNAIKDNVVKFLQNAQENIVSTLSKLNETEANKTNWEGIESSGGGLACIIPKGKIFEKGGVNFSNIRGNVFPAMAAQLGEIPPENLTFSATGVSLVLHPSSPMIPTVHANYRYFEIEDQERVISWYFGGGGDLTPYYLFEEDAIHFHSTLKEACDQNNKDYYPKMKKDADEYFYIPHRKEHRGVGGIFVMKINDSDPKDLFAWMKSCMNAFLPSYVPIIEKRRKLSFGEEERTWQLMRRGRYVEFNLMYDVGTSFGLKALDSLHSSEKAALLNVENILMSLPPHVCWEYNYAPKKGSREAALMEVIKKPKNWVV